MTKTPPRHLAEVKRTLKFRIWDEKNNCWVKDYIQYYPEEELLKQGYVIQQFTCLKDEDGKDIYEGDILEIVWTNRKHKCEIKYKFGAFIAEYINPESTMSFHWLHSIHAYDCPRKVVGNIYEKKTEVEEKTT